MEVTTDTGERFAISEAVWRVAQTAGLATKSTLELGPARPVPICRWEDDRSPEPESRRISPAHCREMVENFDPTHRRVAVGRAIAGADSAHTPASMAAPPIGFVERLETDGLFVWAWIRSVVAPNGEHLLDAAVREGITGVSILAGKLDRGETKGIQLLHIAALSAGQFPGIPGMMGLDECGFGREGIVAREAGLEGCETVYVRSVGAWATTETETEDQGMPETTPSEPDLAALARAILENPEALAIIARAIQPVTKPEVSAPDPGIATLATAVEKMAERLDAMATRAATPPTPTTDTPEALALFARARMVGIADSEIRADITELGIQAAERIVLRAAASRGMAPMGSKKLDRMGREVPQ